MHSLETGDNTGDYSRRDLINGLRKVGLGEGDVVFVVVGPETLGRASGCCTSEQLCNLILTALREVVGTSGTIFIPTYTFSFCRGEMFDVQNTPAAAGPWSPFTTFLEYFRNLPGVIRSDDPIHSMTGMGPKAQDILSNLPPTCFGHDCFFHRLRRAKGQICAIGLGLHETNMAHHAEEMLGVPFRFKKLFTGHVKNNGVIEKRGWLYNVSILAKNCRLDDQRLEKGVREAGICRVARVGLGEVLGIDSQRHFDFASQALARDRWFTAQGPADDPIKLEELRVAGPCYDVKLSANASFRELIESLWRLPRDVVSTGYDAALAALATQTPMKIHEYASGTECWSWIVPEKWTCHEAYLESLDGHRYFSYADNPLHVVSYSLPFDGMVSCKELFEHLHVHRKIPEAIPFVSRCYERDWGLCCSKSLKDRLVDEAYRVVIKSDFSFGTLKVGEVIAPGKSEESIILCAHLCHSAMVNDGLSGVLVGMEILKKLAQRSDLRYTYRLLIVPEHIGSVAYLGHNEFFIERIKGGLCLGMLGLDYPHALQLSSHGTSELDKCFSIALRDYDPEGWTCAYGTIMSSDERQFNEPTVGVPMLGISRVLPSESSDSPYAEHHSSLDGPEITSDYRLKESIALLLQMIQTLERNCIPVRRHRGEVFYPRYGTCPDSHPGENKELFMIINLINGERSMVEIAQTSSFPFQTVYDNIEKLRRDGLVSYTYGRPAQ